MAKLTAHRSDIVCRYFDPTRRCLVAIRSDGARLHRHTAGGWRIVARKKKDIPLQEWKDRVIASYAKLPAYYQGVKSLPSVATLERYAADGIAKTVDGQRIEPDGTAANGAPSWLLALGLI